jgi:hypothetical protein
MFIRTGNDRIRKTCALIAATVILSALAFATTTGNDNSPGNEPRPVPEANAGWVLAPIAGIVLLLSWRQLARRKA